MLFWTGESWHSTFIWGKINEHLFIDTSNSISRLVSGGLLPNNPALALLWLLIPSPGCHTVSSPQSSTFLLISHFIIYSSASMAGTATPGSRTRGTERLMEDEIILAQYPTDSEGITCNLFFSPHSFRITIS